MRIWASLMLIAIAQAGPPAPDAGRPSFADFLAGIREEALMRGIREEIVDAAFSDLEAPLPIVLERDRTQAETVLPLEKYVARLVTTKMIQRALESATANRALLQDISLRYGVPPGIITAIWGIESNFGRFSGVRPTIAALATLAWDPRRSALFRSELLAALEILNHGDIDVTGMRGSWAGAMGQVQFMPSSYLKYAEDFDGDGRRDIWSSPADVFASIANYLKGHGWTAGEPWGLEVHVSEEAARHISASVGRRDGTCRATRDMTVALPMAEWQQLGVRLSDRARLPETAPPAAMVSGATRHFLVFHNYDVLLDYNCAHSYAISVGLLADRVGPSRPAPEPNEKTAQNRGSRHRPRH
ncbi:MAG: lytic murein transglycosylase [Blastocatellia bacterium]|nr:MAG: lytic murein transglycosylase [Blastocatellia bacterium]